MLVTQDTRVRKVQLALKAHLVQLVHRAHLEYKEKMDGKENKD